MSLSTSLGREYMDQFYRGAYFRMEDKLFMYKGHLDPENMLVHVADSASGRWKSVTISHEKIPDMSSFAWPKLGYREFDFGHVGKVKSVWYVSSARSAMRGLQDRHVKMNPIPQMMVIGAMETPKDTLNSNIYMKEIFFPSFTRFSEGMKMIQDGKAIAFALNEDYAVSISTGQGPDVLYDVLHKGTIVGEVMQNLEVVIPRRMAKRQSVINLFEGRVRL